MAILVAIISKIQQIFSSYVLKGVSSNSTTSPFIIGNSLYSMPIIYLIILGCVALIAYFSWQSYRQEIHEEKLLDKTGAKEDSFSSYNLTWLNKLINWAYISLSTNDVPDAVLRWMEDININLAKTKSPIKVLLYGIREGSIPPLVREVGKSNRVGEHIEIPVLLDIQDFGFTISVQEEDNGRIIASTYTAAVTPFQCWNTAIFSRVDDDILAKLEPSTNLPSHAKFTLKLLSDQKISTTVPEVVADLIKTSVLSTPFYINLKTWGPVIPMTKSKKSSTTSEKRQSHKDSNGNTISPSKRKSSKGNSPKGKYKDEFLSPEVFSTPDDDIRKSSTMPSDTSRVLSDQLKTKGVHGLSGSLGSLVGIKRTPSGRGPAKPIRSREKRLVMKVVESTGLPEEGKIYCQATLDLPHQKSKTKPVDSGTIRSWPKDNLVFDLSSRSSEVKLLLYEASKQNSLKEDDSAIASAVLKLDKIDTDKSTEISLPLRIANKDSGKITISLDFTENPVDTKVVNDLSQKFTSPRRSLDLSLIADHLPPLGEKANIRSLSFVSATSSDGSQRDNISPGTTVRTTTTKTVSPRRSSKKDGLPVSQGVPNMKNNVGSQPNKPDIATMEGSVAESAMTDLTEKAEILTPEMKGRIKKGKVVITAVVKSNVNGEMTTEETPVENGVHDDIEEEDVVVEPNGATEMYHSIHSVSSSNTDSTRNEKEVKADVKPIIEIPNEQPELTDSNAKVKKSKRRSGKRPKSLVGGVKVEMAPDNSYENDWPKVRRSRSLVFGKGRKKQYKTGSATDLHKHANAKDDTNSAEGSELLVPENELQKNKRRKSKSITKLFSKLGRKPSIKKSARDSGADTSVRDSYTSPRDESRKSSLLTSEPHKNNSPESVRPNSFAGSESESFISDATSPPGVSISPSMDSSIASDKSVKRSKSLRKRLFGGKRKTTKN